MLSRLQLFDSNGNPITNENAYTYFEGLGTTQQDASQQYSAQQDLLLNRLFFELVRDSGREHTGAAGARRL